ncbi:MAG: hypothetical protein KJ949_02655 [Nanoarchaeota archaeon]|nr:hypothetical protein [Nanoarchaeota archaeon]
MEKKEKCPYYNTLCATLKKAIGGCNNYLNKPCYQTFESAKENWQEHFKKSQLEKKASK